MASISTTNQSFRAKAELVFDYNENSKENQIEINQQFVHFISIKDDYINNVLPIIYASISVEDSLFSKIHRYKDSAKFILTIYKYIYDTNEKSIKVRKKILKKSFSYIPSTSEANPRESLDEATEGGRDSYKKITLGLVSDTMTDQLRQGYNGIYKSIDQSSLLTLALEGLKNPIVEKPDNNKKFSELIIPPLNTRYQLIKYVYEQSPFYDTGFRFYMDFDKTYLLSDKGEKIPGGDGFPDEIMFNIIDLIDPSLANEGMTINDNTYYMDLIPTAIDMIENNALPKTANKVVVINEDGNTSSLELDLSNSEDTHSKTVYVRGISSDNIKNESELNMITISVNKLGVDPTVLTPNKLITVKSYADNSNFNGRYLLCNKEQIFVNTNGVFTIQLLAVLKKVGKLNKPKVDTRTGNSSYTKTVNKAVKSTSRKTTTASKR